MADDNSKQTSAVTEQVPEKVVPTAPTTPAPSVAPAKPEPTKSEDAQQETAAKPADKAPAPAEPVPETAPLSKTIKGLRVFPGVALGKAQKCSSGSLSIPHFAIDKPKVRSESLRLRGAFSAVTQELENLVENPTEGAPAEATAFLEMHLQILCDESLITSTQDIIGERLVNAEWALELKLEELRKTFSEIDDEYLAERIDDISDVFDRIQRVLTGRRQLSDDVELSIGADSIVLFAEKLSPADIVVLKRRYDEEFSGLVLEADSATSHTAILARSLEIPVIVGATGAMQQVETDNPVLLDATHGIVTLFPDKEAVEKVGKRLRDEKKTRSRLKKLRQTESKTVDGVAVHLFSNVALPEDSNDAVYAGAEGIGLFRSEFLFMNRKMLPTEEEQVEAYRRVIRPMKNKRVTLRTMDLGDDKVLEVTASEDLNLSSAEELALSLGKRGLGFFQAHPDIFDTQLRAMLRAAVGSDARIMLPMVVSPWELDFAHSRLAKAEADLQKAGVKYKENIPLGAMIEVPAAAIWVQAFLPKLDFISLGTNDLIQHTLARSRHDPSVNHLSAARHPAVLYLIQHVTQEARAANVPVSICGEIAGEPEMLELLLGLGLRNFSMESGRILALKERILQTNCAECEKAVAKILRMKDPKQMQEAIEALHPSTPQ